MKETLESGREDQDLAGFGNISCRRQKRSRKEGTPKPARRIPDLGSSGLDFQPQPGLAQSRLRQCKHLNFPPGENLERFCRGRLSVMEKKSATNLPDKALLLKSGSQPNHGIEPYVLRYWESEFKIINHPCA